MDADLKRKWIEALRSGEYRQAQSALHDPKQDAYCCLGVLCRVTGAEFTGAVEDDEECLRSYDHVPVLNGDVISNHDDEELSPAFLKKIGLDEDAQRTLVNLNDGADESDRGYQRPHTFAEIAEFIEKNL